MIKLTVLAIILQISSVTAGTDGVINESTQQDLLIDSMMDVYTDDKSIMTNSVRAYDPINKENYENVILGPVHKKPLFKFGRGFTHFRYVTVYNISQDSERIAYLPSFEEDCHDNSFNMASWSKSNTLQVSLSSTLGAKALGLSSSVTASISQGITFSTSRRIKSTLNIKAIHVPYKRSETHTGVTYIQTYNKKTNSYGFLTGRKYPISYELNNQNIGMQVKREDVQPCLED